jgi:hypothetical protein
VRADACAAGRGSRWVRAGFKTRRVETARICRICGGAGGVTIRRACPLGLDGGGHGVGKLEGWIGGAEKRGRKSGGLDRLTLDVGPATSELASRPGDPRCGLCVCVCCCCWFALRGRCTLIAPRSCSNPLVATSRLHRAHHRDGRNDGAEHRGGRGRADRARRWRPRGAARVTASHGGEQVVRRHRRQP